MRTHQRPGALRVITQHHLVPHTHLSQVVYLDQRESTHIACLVRNVARRLDRLAQTPRTLGTGATSIKSCRQYEVTGTLQLPQCLDAARGLRTHASVEKAEMLAHRFGKRGPTCMPVGK